MLWNIGLAIVISFLACFLTWQRFKSEQDRNTRRWVASALVLTIVCTILQAVANAKASSALAYTLSQIKPNQDANVLFENPPADINRYNFEENSSTFVNLFVHSANNEVHDVSMITAAVIVQDHDIEPLNTEYWDTFWRAAQQGTGSRRTLVDLPEHKRYDESPRTAIVTKALRDELLNGQAHLYIFGYAKWHNPSGSSSATNYCARLLHAREAMTRSSAAAWQSCPKPTAPN